MEKTNIMLEFNAQTYRINSKIKTVQDVNDDLNQFNQMFYMEKNGKLYSTNLYGKSVINDAIQILDQINVELEKITSNVRDFKK